MITLFNISLDDKLFLPESYHKIDVLNHCYDCLSETTYGNFVISTTSSYTHSLFNEILDNVKNILIALYQRILSIFNNYILNNVKLMMKYEELVVERFKKLKEPIEFDYYEYPNYKSYPHVIPSHLAIEKEIMELIEEINKHPNTVLSLDNKIDRLIRYFGDKVLGKTVDVNNIKGSTEAAVRTTIQGKKIKKVLEKDDIKKFIQDIQSYKTDKAEITETKHEIIEDYNTLKASYKSMVTKPQELSSHDLLEPDVAEFNANQKVQYANIEVQLTRLFNSFIIIYQVALDTKLNILKEKIEINRWVITEILTRTTVIARLNTTDNTKSAKSSYDAKLKL